MPIFSFHRSLRLVLVAMLALAVGSIGACADQITVFAAASMKNALDEIARTFEDETGHTTTLVYAGTAVLARQIEQGAPANLLVSASVEWMDYLEGQNLIVPESRVVVTGNRMVLIAPKDQAKPVEFNENLDLDGLLVGGLLAMALVDAVPAGIYGKAAMTHYDLWDEVSDRVAQADNVRAALAFVALGQTPLGIVYASDAHAEPRVDVVARIPSHSHAPIRYPAALVAGQSGSGAKAFLDFLTGAKASGVFEQHGFSVPGG